MQWLTVLAPERLKLAQAIFSRVEGAKTRGDLDHVGSDCAEVYQILREVPAMAFAAYDAAVRSVTATPLVGYDDVERVYPARDAIEILRAFAAVAPPALPVAAAVVCAQYGAAIRDELRPVHMVARLPAEEAVARLAAYRDMLDAAVCGRSEASRQGTVALAEAVGRHAWTDLEDLVAVSRAAMAWIGASHPWLAKDMFAVMASLADLDPQVRGGLMADLERLCPPERALALNAGERSSLLAALAALPAVDRGACVDCCSAAAVVPSPYLLAALSKVPAPERPGVLAALELLALPSDASDDLRDVVQAETHIIDAIVEVPAANRDALVRAALQARGAAAWRLREARDVVCGLARVEPAVWPELAGLMARLVQENRTHLIAHLVTTPPASWQAHLARLLAGGGDENVMRPAWQLAVDRSFATLRARYAQDPKALDHFREVLEHVKALARDTARDPSSALQRKRGGAREIDNALRTLTGRPQPGDYSESIEATWSRREDLSLVWHAMMAYDGNIGGVPAAQARANMRYALVMALAQSIEDDGHRVCGVGQRHRLVGVLQGYDAAVKIDDDVATVGQLLIALAEPFDKAWRAFARPPESAIDTFCAEARERSAAYFGAASPEHVRFAAELDAFVALQYPAP